MILNSLSPFLYTENFQETIKFYTEVLEFVCLTENPSFWACLEKDGIQFFVSLPNEHTGFVKAGFTGSFYFKTSNVDEIWDKLKDLAKICYPIEDFDYGMREFAIYDNNGYLLQFGQDLVTDL